MFFDPLENVRKWYAQLAQWFRVFELFFRPFFVWFLYCGIFFVLSICSETSLLLSFRQKKETEKRKTLSFVRRLSVICCRRTINITEDSQPEWNTKEISIFHLFIDRFFPAGRQQGHFIGVFTWSVPKGFFFFFLSIFSSSILYFTHFHSSLSVPPAVDRRSLKVLTNYFSRLKTSS